MKNFHTQHSVRHKPSRSLFLSKPLIEVCVLGFLIGGFMCFIVSHTYFRINDIRVDGLDSFASEKARLSIDRILQQRFFGIPKNNYLLFNPTQLEKEIKSQIAIDSIQIQQRFPHTLIVHASERAIGLRVQASNGVALVANDGSLIRWHEIGAREALEKAQTPYSPITIHQPITNTELFSSVIDSATATHIQMLTNVLREFKSVKLQDIDLTGDDSAVAISFDTGLVVLVRFDADLSVQMKKVKISMERYPLARRIDVRFGDKVFVGF